MTAALVDCSAVVPVGEPAQLSDAELDAAAAAEITAGRFDDAAVFSDKFIKHSGGSIMFAKLAKYFLTARSHFQHIFTLVGTTKVQPQC